MSDTGSNNARVSRLYDAIAMAMVDSTYAERDAIRRALYAAMLADEMNLTAAAASDEARHAAFSHPHRTIFDRMVTVTEEAERAAQAVEYGEGDGGRFYTHVHLPEHVREAVAELLSSGRRIQAIKLVRDNTTWNLRDSKDAVDAMRLPLDKASEVPVYHFPSTEPNF